MNSGALAAGAGGFDDAGGAVGGCGEGADGSALGLLTAGTLLTPALAAEAAAVLTGTGAPSGLDGVSVSTCNKCGAGADHVELRGRRIRQVDDAIGRRTARDH